MSKIELVPFKLSKEYAEEWNERMTDFVVLFKDGVRVNDSIYRVGGIGVKPEYNENYFMLLKYVEAYYPVHIMKMSSDRDQKLTFRNKHLSGVWCILDKECNEKYVSSDGYESVYLIRNSCLYSIDGTYYNIETKECYGRLNPTIGSSEYIFGERTNFKERSHEVIQINKKTGEYTIYK